MDGVELEIDDGTLIIRIGSLSITVLAETVTMFDIEKDIPAKRVPLSDAFWDESADFFAARSA